MNTNDLNTALYEKMAAEQDKFRDWLKSQPPEEILQVMENSPSPERMKKMREIILLMRKRKAGV